METKKALNHIHSLRLAAKHAQERVWGLNAAKIDPHAQFSKSSRSSNPLILPGVGPVLQEDEEKSQPITLTALEPGVRRACGDMAPMVNGI